MNNDELYNQALEAIQELFGDTSVSTEDAIANLESLIGEIEVMISTLEN